MGHVVIKGAPAAVHAASVLDNLGAKSSQATQARRSGTPPLKGWRQRGNVCLRVEPRLAHTRCARAPCSATATHKHKEGRA